jgi:hypothetical protein
MSVRDHESTTLQLKIYSERFIGYILPGIIILQRGTEKYILVDIARPGATNSTKNRPVKNKKIKKINKNTLIQKL